MNEFGHSTISLIHQLADQGVKPAGVIMRHSARTFLSGLHDLDNDLTDKGRDFSHAFGRKLPKSYRLRAYASPPRRCGETAELILRGHADSGGEVTRARPLEVLSVFYALDQMKMFRILREAGDLRGYISRWVRGALPPDVAMDAHQSASMIMRALAAKLSERPEEARLDAHVSHDMTIHLLKACLLGETPEMAEPVEFLEGIVYAFDEGALVMHSTTGGRACLDLTPLKETHS